ncbi:hypothetical protein HDU78_001812 [Chytriomyces hyalinus]|nr:hypothetical protein HDU78_001812 [Chytriomyces hyalinus]
MHSFAAANMKNLQNQQKRISQPMMKPLPQYVMAPPNVNQQGHASTREQFLPYTMPQMLSTPPLTPIPPPIVAPARPAAATPHVIYKQQPVGYAHPSQLGYQIPGNPNPTPVVQPQFYTPQATTGIVGAAQAFPPHVLASQSNSAFGMYSYPQQGANTRRKTLISFSRTEV